MPCKMTRNPIFNKSAVRLLPSLPMSTALYGSAESRGQITENAYISRYKRLCASKKPGKQALLNRTVHSNTRLGC